MARYRSIAEVAGEARANGRTPDAHPQKVADVPGGPRPRGDESRPNKYAGKCRHCGTVVAEGSGVLGPRIDNRFTVEHRGGECNTAAPAPVPSAPKPATERTWMHVNTPVPDGKFTVVLDDGSHVTFDIDTRVEWRDGRDGEVTVVRVLTGSDNESSYTNVGEFFAYRNGTGVKLWKKFQNTERYVEALRVLVGDPRAAAAAYGMESGNCGLCGRTLTVPESIAAGIGPVCMEKAGW